MGYYRKPATLDAIIPNSGTTSPALHLRDYVLVGIIVPAGLTSVTMTFTASDLIGGSYVPVYDSDGNQVSLVTAPSRAIGLSAAEADALAPFQFVKLVFGSAEGAERTIKVLKK